MRRVVADGDHGVVLLTGSTAVAVPCRPDTTGARALLADLRRVDRVELGPGPDDAAVVAVWRRVPHRRVVGVRVALALAAAGFPTVVTLPGPSATDAPTDGPGHAGPEPDSDPVP